MIPANITSILESYVSTLKENTEIIGVFLVGSYATGEFSDTSDIDIKIILNAHSKKHYKGVEVCDGFYISYSAYSVIEAYDYFYSQLRSYSKFQARMLSQGIILYDTTGEMKHLQAEANLVMQLPFIPQSLVSLQLEAYTLWKYKDALLQDCLGVYTQKEFYVFLEKALILYAKLLHIECIFQYPFFKMERYVHDANFREKYMIPKFPDTAFINSFQQGITQTSRGAQKNTVQQLFGYIKEKLQIDFEAFEITSE
ncbi:nucleotidyltransferase domain-containing protein [uncultured Kordia sp.]|uniref:nucleotidyltransferase domain-containing protein n=1 Tax=uncultured Kordia sp. TaxID=507699 RepID=UPI002606D3FD|nr:nucleotidyltransferase domain-containing protein [uncultured Kordia sp.]